jgi:hypothetical protein
VAREGLIGRIFRVWELQGRGRGKSLHRLVVRGLLGAKMIELPAMERDEGSGSWVSGERRMADW